MTSTEQRLHFIQIFSELVLSAKEQGIDIMPFSFHRTAEEQNKLFKEGKSKCDGYKKKSKHQLYLAIDVVVIKDGNAVWDRIQEYEWLGDKWATLGGTWGGNWATLNDIYHFEFSEPMV